MRETIVEQLQHYSPHISLLCFHLKGKPQVEIGYKYTKKKIVNNLMVIYIVSCTSFETITYIHIGNYDLLTPN